MIRLKYKIQGNNCFYGTMVEPEELVEKHTRKELDRIAREEGIDNPEGLPRKLAVAKKIVEKRRTDDYVKKPTGLYIED